ncbi:MAG: hypothetical protein N5P05_002362 [Chroococcopsis gigantea SAG 12.99]|jgi:hypothetical protein|nr:hypothetical protein [Chlorogloea purpurea SAG 13.99]MDV3000756.1 hypothetical protein [Chroococcopsis gigantea SAG 12.99]
MKTQLSHLSIITIALTAVLISPAFIKAQTAKDLTIEHDQPPQSEDFFQPVNNLLIDLQKQGVSIGDLSERMSLKYQVSKPCQSCSVYLGTGVTNGEKDLNNGMGVNLGVGFSMPLSK